LIGNRLDLGLVRSVVQGKHIRIGLLVHDCLESMSISALGLDLAVDNNTLRLVQTCWEEVLKGREKVSD
jgi:hypothetical protein